MEKEVNLKIGKKRIKIKAKVCKSVLSKAIGLIFTRPSKAKPLLFDFENDRRISLHMFFVFFPIQAIWLDKNFKILNKQILKPFSISKPIKAKYVLEIPLTGKFKNI